MVRYGFTSILLLVTVTQVTCQFFDFFSALQPILQNPSRPNYQYDVTTKRPRKTTIKNTRRTNAISYNTAENNSNKRSSTQAPSFEIANNNRRPQKPIKSQNTELHLNTDRNPYSNELNHKYTTQNPFPNRPGVKPAVVNGPPITNKPPTVAPFEESPELILGPDEDYMSNTDKRRHLEFAERMCDKYKSLSMKQLQAIPLVPSPRPLRVNVSSCVPSKVPLVVGGKVVNIKEFPHMVLLGWRKLHSNGYSWKCGGSLLSDRYVLTAAHCAYQDKDNSVITGPPQAAQLGSSYLDDSNALVVKVASVIRHPKYKLPKSYYDIALIKLAKAVSFSDVIKPACLGTPPSPGEPVIATGWGKTEFGGDQSVELRSVSIPVWDMSQCRDVLSPSRKIPDGPSSDTQICAGEMKGGKDTCQGDSGGPAQIQDGCVWRVVAVTSLGRSCGAPRTPALYAIAHPVFISAVVFGEQSKQSNKNKNDYNSDGNYNQNTPRDNNYESNSRRNVGTSQNTRYRNDQQASGSSYDQNYGSNQNSQRPYDEENHSTNPNYGNDRNNNYNQNRESNNKEYGNSQNSRRRGGASDTVVNNSENNNQGISGNGYNPNYASNNENSRNERFETTTSGVIKNGVKYIKYDNDNYNTNKKNQNNYYQTDRNTDYNQQSHQIYRQEDNNDKSSNYDRQNDDPNSYSRNQDRNSQIFYQADRNQYDIKKPYESDSRQSDTRVWWT